MSEGTQAPVAPKNNTGTIALIVAGILLFVVCAMAYKDYVDSTAERDRSQWTGQQPGQNGYQNPQNNVNGNYNNQPGQQIYDQNGRPIQPNGYQNTPNNQVNTNNGNFGGQQPPVNNGGQPVPPASINPNTVPVTTPPNGNVVDVFATAPPAATSNAGGDPNSALEVRRRELEQLRNERMIAEGQLRDLENGGTGNATGVGTGVAAASTVIDGPVPGIPSIPGIPTSFPGSGTPIASPEIAPTGVAGQRPAFTSELIGEIDPEWKEKVGPELFEKLKQEEASRIALGERIRNSPAIATVKMYDTQWNFVEIDGGKDRNLRMKQRLTVRRGKQILGVVEITELGDNYAVAELKSPNAKRDDTLKPQAGDELIPAELF